MCIIASAMICGTFASCGKNESSESKSDTKTTTAATTATTTTEAAETETTTAETTEAVTTTTETTTATTDASGNDDDAAQEHLTDASAILNNLNIIDGMGGGVGVETDETDTKEVGTAVYEKVTDSRFTTVDDVKKYVTDSVCGTLLDRYSFLYQGQDTPFFKEFDGVLYFCKWPRGSGFSFNSEPVITDVTDDSFRITVTFNNFGGNSELVVKAVKDNGLWKASSFTVDGSADNVR